VTRCRSSHSASASARRCGGSTASRKSATLTAVGLVLASTFLFSAYKVWLRFNSSRSKRRRLVGKNAVLVEALSKFLPHRRSQLTEGAVRALSLRTGFSRDAVFRKFTRFILNERPFDQAAVDDVLALRAACGLPDEAVSGALREAAERTFKSTGILMRRQKGLTAEGLARKVEGRSVFSKLLYLAESERLLGTPEARAAAAAALMAVFGATSEDAEALRIPSLTELDNDALERMWAAGGREDAPTGISDAE
jgi:hypothetical protein